ncbi:MAG: gliding motility-associated C-terminal domain-containing protein [Bacteroidetes bacterium]|nr:gliding motility-associated C-terminal domain-containing protein [Bacteroidota bacterium]
MMKHFTQRIILITGIFSSLCFTAQATHIVGGYASYTCLGGSTYRLSYTIYVECGTGKMVPPSWDWVNYESISSCGPPLANWPAPGILIPVKSGFEYSSVLLCPSMANDNTCNGGANANFAVVKYDTVLTFPNQCNDWRFYFGGGGQFAWDLTNIKTGVNVPYIETWIDNTNGNCNNSVLFEDLPPVHYTCVNNTYHFGTGAFDPDGDSLAYQLAPVAAPADYIPPYTGTEPIPGITIDSLTGIYTFTPSTIGKYIVGVYVDEYDCTTKALRNSTLKMVEVIVQACTNMPPDPTTGIVTNLAAPAVKTGSYSIELGEGDSLIFQIPVSDPNAGDIVSFYTSFIQQWYLPGSTVSVSNTNPATLKIKWKAPLGSAGTTIYLPVTATDDACPRRALTTFLYTITIKDKVSVTQAQANTTICKGASTSLSATGGTSFTWTALAGGDPINVPANFSCNPCANPIASPTATTSYAVTSDLGSNNKDTVVITVNNLPAVNAGSDNTICKGNNTTLNSTASLSSYLWTPATGLSSTTISNPAANPTITTTYTLTAANANGCVNTDNVKITVDAVNAAASADANICPGDSTSLSVTGTGTSFAWIPAAGLNNTNISNPLASPAVTTTYTVTVSNASACSAADSVKVTVNAAPTLSVTPVSPAALCSGNIITLTATGAANYVWSPATNLSSTTGSVVTANPTTTITYTVTGTSALSCVNTATINVAVNTVPTVSVTPATPTTLCSGSSITLTATGATTYTWSPATGLNPTTGTDVTAKPLISTAYTVTGTDINGCTGNQTVTLTVIGASITLTASPIIITPGDSTQLNAAGGDIYLWSPSTGLNCDTCPNPKGSPNETTDYCVTVIDIVNGCSGNECITITVDIPCGTLFIPNAFSPNGDGENDTLKVYIEFNCIKDFHLVIFDRWGERVFESLDQQKGWDGTFGGKILDPAVFAYYLNVTFIKGESISKKGNISLIR